MSAAHRSEADQALASRLSETLSAANRRWRQGLPFGSAFICPPFPEALIDQVAAGLVPVLRELVVGAVAAQDPSDAAWSAHLAHVTKRQPAEAADVLELTSPPRDLRKVLP